MELLLEAFKLLVSPEQREMQTLISKHGGEAQIRNNDKVLQQLLKESSHLVETDDDTRRLAGGADGRDRGNAFDAGAVATGAGSSNVKPEKPLTAETLKQELAENVNQALTKNMEIFERKFEIQKRQIKEDLARVVGREGDRIIAAVTTGPHDRILDPDMHAIWKEMVRPSRELL
jgi:hypothetical protein